VRPQLDDGGLRRDVVDADDLVQTGSRQPVRDV
jgi:hypothetical protein